MAGPTAQKVFRSKRDAVAPDERFSHVDILRGSALLGVLMVNLLTAFRVPLLQHLRDFHTHPGRLNQVVDLLLGVFVEEKAITVFSILFGVSMAIQFERRQSHGVGYLGIGLRRLLTLAALGLLHLVFIWNGDILTLYALTGLLLLPALWLPRRAVLAAALVLLVLPTLQLRLPLPQLDFAALSGHVTAALGVYAKGGYGQIFSFRQLETRLLIIPLLSGILPRTLGLMLLGEYVWRCGILRDPENHVALLRAVAWLGIPLGLLINIGQALAAYAHRSLGRLSGLADALSTTPLALGYAALLLLILRRPALSQGRALTAVADLGRMALTCYLSQSVVLGAIFYGYGLGLFGRLGSAEAAPLGLMIYAAQLVLCRLWLKRYQFGPVEWLWRSVTYGRLQPLRCLR